MGVHERACRLVVLQKGVVNLRYPEIDGSSGSVVLHRCACKMLPAGSQRTATWTNWLIQVARQHETQVDEQREKISQRPDAQGTKAR